MIAILLVTLCTSIVGAISGIGGGVIIKPVLEIITDKGVETISFLSSCTVLAMAIVSLLRQRRSTAQFDMRRGTACAIGSAVGGVLGKLLFDLVRGQFGSAQLGASQSAVLCVMMIGLLCYMRFKARIRTLDLHSGLQCGLLGAGLGLISSFLGIGGGPMNLALLTYFMSMDNKSAALHSIYIILFSQVASLLLTLARGTVPAVYPPELLCAIAGGVGGALVGSALSKRLGNRAVGTLYTAILGLVLALSVNNLAVYLRQMLGG